MNDLDSDGYVQRAATLALVWSELLDDVSPAEECANAAELTARRDQLRRELRAHLERGSLGVSADKWVQRAFWSAPPKRGSLDDRWKQPLLEWVAALGLSPESVGDVNLAVRGLFGDNKATAELATRRPALREAVANALGAGIGDDEIVRLAGTQLFQDSFLPVYLTDRDVQRIVWSNRSLQALLGMAHAELARLGFERVLARFTAMVPPEQQPHFVQRQEEVRYAGQSIGHGYISTVIDLSRRPWTHGLDTPPWRGVYRVESHAHFVTDRRGARVGSVVVMVPQQL